MVHILSVHFPCLPDDDHWCRPRESDRTLLPEGSTLSESHLREPDAGRLRLQGKGVNGLPYYGVHLQHS